MVIDVTEATFGAEVLDRSATLPVVVDFWAEWCGPCRQLGPVLEAGAAKREGQLVLAKVDTDANPRLSQDYRIQGIPAVKAFRDGHVVSEFTGAQPPASVERFLDALVPSEADGLVTAGDEASLRRAVELEPSRADAAVPLARILLDRDETDAADALLREVPGSFAADGLRARIALERRGDPDLSTAWAAWDAGDHEVALDALLAAMLSAGHRSPEASGRWAKDDVRRVVVGILDELGAEDPRTRDYRRRLASALY